MCDTLVATPNSVRKHLMLFGKNSDRQRNEAQGIELHQRALHAADEQLRCTYITVPQVPLTYATLLCRPYWIWGAEMGANEHAVAIGNEGLHAQRPAAHEPALTGMDLVRLALERSSTAVEAVDVITGLLERHGQGGNCGHLTASFYNNGFIIADPREAFVLETVGREWLVERVVASRSISNRYSIDAGAERVSRGLHAMLREAGWNGEAEPRYAEVIRDPDREHVGNAGARHARSTSLLGSRDGVLIVSDMMSILRDHGGSNGCHDAWREECAVQRTLCMHAGAEDRLAQTVGSMVSELNRERPVHWVTATAAPCMSIFKPVLLNVPLPVGPPPDEQFDPRALWWRHEALHRAALLSDFGALLEQIRPEREALEADFRQRMSAVLNGGDAADCAQAVAGCWDDANRTEKRWWSKLGPARSTSLSPYTSTWMRMNRLAGIDGSRLHIGEESNAG